jgi:hypothetical protein
MVVNCGNFHEIDAYLPFGVAYEASNAALVQQNVPIEPRGRDARPETRKGLSRALLSRDLRRVSRVSRLAIHTYAHLRKWQYTQRLTP